MSVLVKTLHKDLERADTLFAARLVPRARAAYERLVQAAQEKTDRQSEIMARAMLVRCMLAARDLDGARDQLLTATAMLHDEHLPTTHGRVRGAAVRFRLEEGPVESAIVEMHEYYQWASSVIAAVEMIDACELLARQVELEERVEWLERGIDHALEHNVQSAMGDLYTHLATALDQLDRLEPALSAWQQALRWQQQTGTERDVVAANWAVGAAAARGGDWPLARTQLEQASVLAQAAGDCDDLLGLTLADLAVVYEAAGDVIEARRLLVRSIELGRAERLNAVWPQRWGVIIAHARRLEVL